MQEIMRVLIIYLASLVLTGCLGMPETVTPVSAFDLNRYLGKWYEIARLDHSFERGLERVTADYSVREDGGVAVVNRGYSPMADEWKVAEGKAYFVDDENVGYLRVSFFGPFYGSYVIFELDKEGYEYAFISGPNKSYLWLLSRKPNLPKEIVDKFLERSKALGFDTRNVIFVKQN